MANCGIKLLVPQSIGGGSDEVESLIEFVCGKTRGHVAKGDLMHQEKGFSVVKEHGQLGMDYVMEWQRMSNGRRVSGGGGGNG